MSSPIISVRNIGKKYKLGATLGGRNYKTLRDVLTKAAFGPFQKLSAAFRKELFTGGKHSSPNNPITKSHNNLTTKSPNNPITQSPNNPQNSKEFWALKDISFDVQQGEVVGIIGANGAGKSTLLKILSEITEPTEGEVRIRGRIASLLEVGTGFHPELSGRENVYMNGAILGMTKAEIDAKFDEIVAFAEVEKFIDTPVKRYSSGMSVRLAFAVAAYLEPEILLVDEVLAVGDVNFQKKCLGRMSDVGKNVGCHCGRKNSIVCKS
jgi:lipopolysaccharide transport system ATP-binding protein